MGGSFSPGAEPPLPDGPARPPAVPPWAWQVVMAPKQPKAVRSSWSLHSGATLLTHRAGVGVGETFMAGGGGRTTAPAARVTPSGPETKGLGGQNGTEIFVRISGKKSCKKIGRLPRKKHECYMNVT